MISVAISGYGDEVRADYSEVNEVEIVISGHGIYTNPLKAFIYSAVTKKNKNIVCAAVSALSLNFLKSLILIAGFNPEYEQRNGYLSVLIKPEDTDQDEMKTFIILMDSFILGINDLKNNYPDLIEIEYK